MRSGGGLCLWRGPQPSLHRSTWVLAHLFLALNNVQIGFAPKETIHMVVALASGSLTEGDVAEWFRARLS